MTTKEMERAALQSTLAGGQGNTRGSYGYYRLPDGWIKVAVVTEIEELKYRREGWEPMPQYGRFDMASAYAASHPLELLFINNGAHELSEAQIRQQGLYMYPQRVPTCRQALTQYHKAHNPSCWVGAQVVEFPQVAHMDHLGPFACQFCGVEKPTIEARRQHENVMHKDEKAQVRTGEALATALKGVAGGSPANHTRGRPRKAKKVNQGAPLT